MKLVKEPVQARAGESAADARELLRCAVIVLRSLGEMDDLLPILISKGVTEPLVALVRDPEQRDVWAVGLQMLSSIAQRDKEERNRIVRSNLVMHLLGDVSQYDWCLDAAVKTGLEPVTIPVLELVETLATKDTIRTFLVERTRAVHVMTNILQSATQDAMAVACRLMARLCATPPCRAALRTANLHERVAAFFCNAVSPSGTGASGAALAHLCGRSDRAIAQACLPRICDVLQELGSDLPTKDWDFNHLAVPGAFRAARAFAEITSVQDVLVKYLGPILALLVRQESSDIAKADAAQVLAGIAIKASNHRNILDRIPSPVGVLMKLIIHGTVEQLAGASKAILHLTCSLEPRLLVARFSHSSRRLVNQRTLQEVVHTWDALDAVALLLSPGQRDDVRTHGAGILRNLSGLDDMRSRAFQRARADSTLLRDLAGAVGSGPPACRIHAAAAVGNLCTTPEMADALRRAGAVQAVAGLLAGDGWDDKGEEGGEGQGERLQVAARTLGLLAHDEDAVKEMIQCKVLEGLHQLLSSRSRTSKLVAAKALQNISCFPSRARDVMANAPLLDTLFASLMHREEAAVQESLIACIANLAVEPAGLPTLVGRPGRAKALVTLARKGSAPQRAAAARLLRQVASTQDQSLLKPLFAAGAIEALVARLSEGRADAEGGAAENAAAALARLAAASPDYAAALVEARGIEPLVSILGGEEASETGASGGSSGGAGCVGVAVAARVQAAKALIILSDDYASLLVQTGCITAAREALSAGGDAGGPGGGGSRGGLSHLAGLLLESLLSLAKRSERRTSMVEREVNAKMAVLVAQAEKLRDRDRASDGWLDNGPGPQLPLVPLKGGVDGLDGRRRQALELHDSSPGRLGSLAREPDMAGAGASRPGASHGNKKVSFAASGAAGPGPDRRLPIVNLKA